MAEPLVLMESRDAVRVITINRPKVLNALSLEVFEALDAVLSELENDSSARAAVMTGAGDRAFVAGADIRQMKPLTPVQARAFSAAGHRVMDRITAISKPIIAAVNGFALGGGLELALACDFIYASESAVLGLVEADLGLIPGFGGVGRLVRRIGPAAAREALYTAHKFSAAEALDIGLVNRVFAPEELFNEAFAVANHIAKLNPTAIALTRSLIETASDADLAVANAAERDSFGLIFSSADAQEGMTAYLEKRKPVFKGEEGRA